MVLQAQEKHQSPAQLQEVLEPRFALLNAVTHNKKDMEVVVARSENVWASRS